MNIVVNVLVLIGFGLITYGLYLIKPFVALIGGGIFILIFAGLIVFMESDTDEKKPTE